MFTFEPMERCLYGRISSSIGHPIHNEFLLVLGYKEIDYRMSIVLNERNIQFFYYKGDVDFQNARDMDQYKEVGTISLTNPKETGADILKFPTVADDNLEPPEKLLKSFKDIFYNFPLMENTEFDSPNNKNHSIIFFKCCLLAFIFEFEDRHENFSCSPLYDTIRDNLRKSDVYNLLSAKLHYTIYVPKDSICLNPDEYTYKARKFADRLMNSRINKVIPPSDYPEKNDQTTDFRKQLWFYDPETELESILDKNRKQELLSSKDNPLCLEDTLVLKIRDFFYTKHAVYQAMTRAVGKNLFLCAQILMAITSLMILLSSFFPKQADSFLHTVFPITVFAFSTFCLSFFLSENNRENQKKSYNQLWILIPLLILLIFSVMCLLCKWHLRFWVFYAIVVVSIFIWILASGCYNNPDSTKKTNGIIYALYPRILVAELAAWLTIGIAEDLVKSMLWIKEWWIPVLTTISVFLLITLILLGETKQHSPYKRRYPYIFARRILPILNHSVFFALCFGLVMQVVFYNNLIKNSDVMSSVVFNDYFDDANYYCELLEDIDNTIAQYENLSFLETNVHTNSSSEARKDSSASLKTNLKAELSLFTDLNEYIRIHNGVVTNFNDISLRLINNTISLKSLQKKSSDSSYSLSHDFITLDSIQTDSINEIKFVRKKNIDTVISMRPLLHNEISLVRSLILKYNNYDTLMNWATIKHSSKVNTGSRHLDSLTSKAIENHNCCKQINPFNIFDNKKIRIFPTLLIFHTLIVLVLAFVTQLLISDKSVTEPL